MNAVTPEQVTLYYREGSSDKVYQAALEPAANGFVVNFAYGRRGTTLITATKTSSPVAYANAKKIYAKLIGEKKAKGYTEGVDGTPYQHTDKQVSGILPQLLNPVEEAEVEALLRNDSYCAQEKFDGRHLLVRKQNEKIEGINKKGLIVGLPETLRYELETVPGNVILDGESIGDDYHVFDLLEQNGENLRMLPYLKRLTRLGNLLVLGCAVYKHIKRVDTAYTDWQKTELLGRLRRESREGMVFKHLDAPYVPGRPNQGGAQLKFKLVTTVSVIVAKINAQRSVELSLFQGRSLVSCGNVTIPPNHEIPPVGMVVEVRYLYAYRDSLALYQPVYLGARDDIEAGECVVAQLKFKPQ